MTAGFSHLFGSGGVGQGNGSSEGGGFFKGVLDVVGKIWALPNTIVGLTIGIGAKIMDPFGVKIDFAYNSIVFSNVGFQQGANGSVTATTFGNVIIAGSSFEELDRFIPTYYAQTYGGQAALNAQGFNRTHYGRHEQGHTYQYQLLGPLYMPAYLLSSPFTASSPWENAADAYGAGRGSWMP